MKANSTENIIANQLFKITKSDENISDYLIDCGSPFNIKIDSVLCPIGNGVCGL